MPLTKNPIPNCYWASPHLVGCEYPGSVDPDKARRKIGALLDAGVTAFVDLTEADESTPHGKLAPYDALLHDEATRRGVSVRYDRFPVRDLDVPLPETMRSILNHLDALRTERRIAAVHCRGGIGRTGTVVGCHYVRGGMTGTEALAELATRWATAEQSSKPWGIRSPETDAQHAYVRAWQER